MPIFEIGETESKRFQKILTDYFHYIKEFPLEEARDRAETGFENLVNGMDLKGNEFPAPSIVYFDSRLKQQTDDFYQPTSRQRIRYRIANKSNKVKKKKYEEKVEENTSGIDFKKLEEKKRTLLQEWPFLDKRRDLDDVIDNYCVLSLKVNSLLLDGSPEAIAQVKNLTETQVKLGTYLGISESERQKQKLLESKDNIAALSVQFEQTIDEWPELVSYFKYYEVVMLLQKFDRGELDRELFELDSMAGMSVESARDFVKKNKDKA